MKLGRGSVIGVIVLFLGVHAMAISTVTVSPGNLQRVEYWGVWASDNRPDWGSDWVVSSQPKVLDALYNDLGVNLARISLDYTSYNETTGELNQTNMGYLKTHIQGFTSRGVGTYFMSVWTPPPSMKTRNTPSAVYWNNGVKENVSLRPDQEDKYIQYVASALQWLKSNNVPLPYAFSLQNEPDYNPDYDGCVYDSIQYRRVLKKMRTHFDANGLGAVKLMGPEGGGLGSSQTLLGKNFGSLDSDPEFNAALGIIASHNYNSIYYIWADYFEKTEGFSWQNYYKSFQAGMNNRTQAIWMTEYCSENSASIQWKYAPSNGDSVVQIFGVQKEGVNKYLIMDSEDNNYFLTEAQHFNSDLINMGATAWVRWGSWNNDLNKKDYPYLIRGTSTIDLAKTYQLYQTIWTHATPGSYVRKVTTDDPHLIGDSLYGLVDLSAMVNEKHMVVVLVNRTDLVKNVQVQGLTGSAGELYQMTKTSNMTKVSTPAIASGRASISLQAHSASILVTNQGVTNPTRTWREDLQRYQENPGFFDFLGRNIGFNK